MVGKQYLLDTNIVIKVWSNYPDLFDEIEKVDRIDFKISQEIAVELSQKEFNELKGVPILTNRFIKLLGHIIDTYVCISKDSKVLSDNIKQYSNNNLYILKGNKISINDYGLIRICKSYTEYILVTEDKKMIKSARLVLGASRVLNFDEFIEDLKELNVLNR